MISFSSWVGCFQSHPGYRKRGARRLRLPRAPGWAYDWRSLQWPVSPPPTLIGFWLKVECWPWVTAWIPIHIPDSALVGRRILNLLGLRHLLVGPKPLLFLIMHQERVILCKVRIISLAEGFCCPVGLLLGRVAMVFAGF
jgi:hypothetical protein